MKLHPATVPYRAISRSVSTGTFFFLAGVFASGGEGFEQIAFVAAFVVVGVLVGVAYEVAYYRRFRYVLTDDTFDVISGVLSRRRREVPLRRIQNVDVSQSVLQRALGIAAVQIETAGGGETEVGLRFVGEEEANRLKRILRQGSAEKGVDAAVEQPHEEEEELFAITPTELAVLSVFSIDAGASILATVLLSFASGFDPSTLAPFESVGGFGGDGGIGGDLVDGGLLLVAWLIALFVLVAWVLSATLTFARYYGFRLTRVDDELYYERGLLQRYSGTIPLDKVQTLTIKETLLWRHLGFASLAVETAGYAPGRAANGSESAVPLARTEHALDLARSIEPFGALSIERPPLRALERYAVRFVAVVVAALAITYALARYVEWFDRWYLPAVALLVAPAAAYLTWRNRGYRAGEAYWITRVGFWRRTTKVVPYYRIQAVSTRQTIFQRNRRLASVIADTASSASFLGRSATAIDVDARDGESLRSLLGERLQQRLRERKERRGARRLIDAEGFGDGTEGSEVGDVRGGARSEEPTDATRAGGKPDTGSESEGGASNVVEEFDPDRAIASEDRPDAESTERPGEASGDGDESTDSP